jgi:hypothetical protein
LRIQEKLQKSFGSIVYSIYLTGHALELSDFYW